MSLRPGSGRGGHQRELEEYRGVHDRLADVRRRELWRQRRADDLTWVPDPAYHARNLAARPGTLVRVDSFLGTVNSEDADDAYRPPGTLGGHPFPLERSDHPVLAELRARFALHEVAGSGSVLDRAVRLRTWLKGIWPHGLPLRNPPYDGLVILDRATRGVDTFMCMHYSVVLIHCCLSLGLQARLVNLHRGISESYPIGEEGSVDPPVDEHVTTEVWLPEFEKWAMLDPDFDCHYERQGVPQSAWEIHRAFVMGETDSLDVRQGTGFSEYESLGPDFYPRVLPSYYAHVTILQRNDFLSDPDGPIPALHLVDEWTPPILWHRGEDMRLHPNLLGPLVVATPYTDQIPLLSDGNLDSGWASADGQADHWVEIELAEPATVRRVVLHWPEWRRRFRTSRSYAIQAGGEGGWRELAAVERNPECPWTVHDVDPVETDAVRITQPPGGGFKDHPDRLWLTQVEVFA